MNSFVLALALFASAAYADPLWNSLRVTWNPNPFSKWGFVGVPRDLTGDLGNFHSRDNQCQVAGAKFLGQRYWWKDDPALTLLYDTNGIIAGIQTSLPKSAFTPPATLTNKNYQDDGDYWTLTAYFVNPSTICGAGRSKELLASQGTGTGLWIQWGPDPVKDSIQVPTSEEEMKKTNWKYGHCFWTMGKHYWYNVTKDMSCDNFIPNCVMYNKGKLTAFCFSINAGFTSPRYEHPTAEISKKFIDPVPDCFFKDPTYKKLSTIHIYFIDNPRTGSFC